MSHYQGKILSSTSSMDDPNFGSSVVFIAEHNERGALGFVINKIFNRTLNELVEFSGSPAFPLYEGGPVDQEHLYFVHRRNDIIPGGAPVIDDIYLGGDFQKTIEQINNHNLTSKDIKIFIGYCGWDTGELEAEIAEGSWEVKALDVIALFTDNVT
ncbi:YqgE/AlgH family protein [Niabella sp. 22666]|uniref:YqgE/AlgH family protein n=1 Tax=Niabella sp. 22666 TaxID=3453954 RepID=UPI003F859C87